MNEAETGLARRGLKAGALLVNLGSPGDTSVPAVRAYLREFLSDPRVIDLPAAARSLLLNLVILPFRPRRSAHAYQAIWTPEGSPLVAQSRKLTQAVQAALGRDDLPVELAMRYGEPSMASALARLEALGCDRIILVPLYPQYASSTTGSTIERLFELVRGRPTLPTFHIVPEFYDDPGFIEAVVERTRETLAAENPEHVVFSFHGLPERHLRTADASGHGCLARTDCCESITSTNRRCYRAQCLGTAHLVAKALDLPPERYEIAFQSRLGRTPWIRPYLDEVLSRLARSGTKRVAVVCPSFVVDCLETLEEIGIRGRASFREQGGTDLHAVPCPNDHVALARALAQLIERAAAA